MIQKMPTSSHVCKVCKELAKAIPILEKQLISARHQYDTATDPDPVKLAQWKKCALEQIEWESSHLQGMKTAYKNILGVEYGSEQTHEVYKPSMDKYLNCTLYRRGITKIEYEDIEPKNGKPYVRIYWTEKI